MSYFKKKKKEIEPANAFWILLVKLEPGVQLAHCARQLLHRVWKPSQMLSWLAPGKQCQLSRSQLCKGWNDVVDWVMVT